MIIRIAIDDYMDNDIDNDYVDIETDTDWNEG